MGALHQDSSVGFGEPCPEGRVLGDTLVRKTQCWQQMLQRCLSSSLRPLLCELWNLHLLGRKRGEE